MKTLIKILCLSVFWFSCEEPEPDVYGCTYDTACNFNQNATVDDGTCIYELDCAGECGGNGVDEDEDGICDDIDDCVGEYSKCIQGIWKANYTEFHNAIFVDDTFICSEEFLTIEEDVWPEIVFIENCDTTIWSSYNVQQWLVIEDDIVQIYQTENYQNYDYYSSQDEDCDGEIESCSKITQDGEFNNFIQATFTLDFNQENITTFNRGGKNIKNGTRKYETCNDYEEEINNCTDILDSLNDGQGSEFAYGEIPFIINQNQLQISIGCVDIILERVDSIPDLEGCTNPNYLNYNPMATIENNSCNNNLCYE